MIISFTHIIGCMMSACEEAAKTGDAQLGETKGLRNLANCLRHSSHDESLEDRMKIADALDKAADKNENPLNISQNP